MTALSWENAKVANGPKILAWLDDNHLPVPAKLRAAWEAGGQATLNAIDRILTHHGQHLWMVPDHVWEPPRSHVHPDKVRVRVLAAYDRTGSKKGAAYAARVPVSTARHIIDRERAAA